MSCKVFLMKPNQSILGEEGVLLCTVENQPNIYDVLKYKNKFYRVVTRDINFFFGDTEQFERTIKSRGIEFAYQGMKIHVCGKSGKIAGANSSCNLDVVFDEDFLRGQPHKRNCHPLYMTKYFDRQDNLIAEYKD